MTDPNTARSIQCISYGALYGPNGDTWVKELASKARQELEKQGEVRTLIEPEFYPGKIPGTVNVVYTALVEEF